MDYQSVRDEVESWPVDDRIRLVQDVWDRLADHGDEPELTMELKAELDRRMEELDRDPDVGVPWEEVKARVLGRLRR
jgi:putative addiction module component (TIGR02574 family)